MARESEARRLCPLGRACDANLSESVIQLFAPRDGPKPTPPGQQITAGIELRDCKIALRAESRRGCRIVGVAGQALFSLQECVQQRQPTTTFAQPQSNLR